LGLGGYDEGGGVGDAEPDDSDDEGPSTWGILVVPFDAGAAAVDALPLPFVAAAAGAGAGTGLLA